MVAPSAPQTQKQTPPSYAEHVRNARISRDEVPYTNGHTDLISLTSLSTSQPLDSTLPTASSSKLSGTDGPATDKGAQTRVNGEDINLGAPSSSRHPSLSHPITNVWEQRLADNAREPHSVDNRISGPTNIKPNSVNRPIPSHLPNGRVRRPDDDYDAFVVRPPAASPRDDEEAWPEIGNARVRQDIASTSSILKPERNHTRRAEKPKWVPIPPSELQATADALSHSSQSSRQPSQRRSYSRSNEHLGAHGTLSDSAASQISSRTPSTYTSNPHSRIQSRTGSVQASPRFAKPPLPGDDSFKYHKQEDNFSYRGRTGAYGYEPALFLQDSFGYSSKPYHDIQYLASRPYYYHPNYDVANAASQTSTPPYSHPTDPGIQWNLYPVVNGSSHAGLFQPEAQLSSGSNGFISHKPRQEFHLVPKHLVFGSLDPIETRQVHITASTSESEAEIRNPNGYIPLFMVGVPEKGISGFNWKKMKRRAKLSTLDPEAVVANADGSVVIPKSAATSSHNWRFGFFHESPVTPNLSEGQYVAPLLRHVALSESSQDHKPENSDAFEVRDFGFGFGRISGTRDAPAVVREEILARQKEREEERNRQRESIQPGLSIEREGLDREREWNRPRRGSFGGTYDRGVYPRRGRGSRGFPRGPGHRNFSAGHLSYPRQAPFTPPQNYQHLPGRVDRSVPYCPPTGYGAYGVGYDVYGYGPYQPTASMVAPITSLPFPLDANRYHLLGQLEYYLSPQNMVQDFYLRQQMDPQGWLPVHLLASFNRVRQLTTDINVVRDVLSLSSIVEVVGDWVRMGGQEWQKFILQNQPTAVNQEDTEELEVEEDDDEVEFVIG